MSHRIALRDKCILIVEDEYFIAEELRQALSAAGARVAGPSPSVTSGLEQLGSQCVDAAILDVNLRGEMSFPLADALTEQGTPFLLATGYDEWVIPTRFGAVPRVSKPFSLPAVLSELTRILGVAQ